MAKAKKHHKAAKGHIPVKILEHRAQKLVNVLKKRHGKLPKC